MLRKVLLLAALVATQMATAQNVLEVTDVSQPNDVYSSADNEAAIIVKCHQSIPLRFSSSMDKSANPFRTDLQGSDSVYYIAFPTGNRYRGRELTIYSRGYTAVTIPMELQPKQLVSLLVIDPNSMVDAGCYRGHRNKGVEEIKNMNYEEARNQFVVAQDCSDVDQAENDHNIALVDSLIFHRQAAETAYKLLDYHTASYHYNEVLALNPYDTYASNRNTLCIQNFTQECDLLFTKAEFYFSDKQYDKAKELYEKVVDQECRNMVLATERLNSITSLQTSKKDHARVLTYEYRKDTPLGLHYGKYNMHKVGGFIGIDISNKVFDALRNECQYGDDKFPEFNINFGWTVKIVNPVWIYFGPGFTGKFYYGKYKSSSNAEKHFPGADGLAKNGEADWHDDMKSANNDTRIDAEKKLNIGPAISPVIGICAKYSYFALRVTYQYRFTLQKELEDFVGKQRLSVGVGVAF